MNESNLNRNLIFMVYIHFHHRQSFNTKLFENQFIKSLQIINSSIINRAFRLVVKLVVNNTRY